jgi:hypothetical protein
VQAEPWLERDKTMIDPLKTIGIERGKSFNPDARTKDILEAAITEAHSWLDARIDTLPPTPDSFPMDARGMAYSLAFFSAKHVGEAQYYLMTTKDRVGTPWKAATTIA